MKTVVRSIINLCYAIDSRLGKIEKWEKGWYCGEHRCGHQGWLTDSGYWEGEGGESAKVGFLLFTNYTDGRCSVQLLNPFPPIAISVRFGVKVLDSDGEVWSTLNFKANHHESWMGWKGFRNALSQVKSFNKSCSTKHQAKLNVLVQLFGKSFKY